MMQHPHKHARIELFGLLIISAVIAGFVFVLAAEKLTTSILSGAGERIENQICSMCTSTVTKGRQPKKLDSVPQNVAPARVYMASLNPKDPSPKLQSISPNQPNGIGIMMSADGFAARS